jgi:NitT/TauT family transport system ATP-binding protein
VIFEVTRLRHQFGKRELFRDLSFQFSLGKFYSICGPSGCGKSTLLRILPEQLSGGMKMRASLARALMTQPSLLFLDEPFAALDENTRHILQQDLRSMMSKDSSKTCFFVTHSVSEAIFLSDEVLVLDRNGSLKLKLQVSEEQKRETLLRFSETSMKLAETVTRAYDV